MSYPQMAARKSRLGRLRRFGVLGLATVASAALIAGTSASAAVGGEGVIREGGSPAIPNSYIVVFKDAAVQSQSVGASVSRLSAKFGGKVGHEYHRALRGFSVTEMGEEQAKRLAADPSVAYVERNAVVKKQDTQTNPGWNLDRIDQPALPLDNSYSYPSTAATVHAYVIDTGIRISHTEFGGRASYGYNFFDLNPNADDCDVDGHGTHVAGTLGGSTVGVAKGVALVAVKVLDCDGFGTVASVVSGVDWVAAVAVKPAVANMSLGTGTVSPALNEAVRQAIASGVTFSVAAGNGDSFGNPLDACGKSPGSLPEAITVAATNIADQRAYFSNYGSCVDLFAPGVDVRSSLNTGDSSYGSLQGTSMASPHVGGAAALILAAHPTYTPAQVRDVLVGTAALNVVSDPRQATPSLLLNVRNAVGPQVASETVGLNNPRLGTFEVYARSADNHIVYTSTSPGRWSWTDLGGDVVGDPALLYNPNTGATEVYVRTSANHLAYRSFTKSWSPWVDLGGDLAGSPAVLFNPRFGSTEVYVRTSQSKLSYVYFSSNVWSGWNDLQGDVASDPVLLYNPLFGSTEAYVRSNSNELVYRYWSNGWSGWISLGGSIAGNPTILFNPRFGSTELYSRTTANRLAYRYFSGNAWSGWNDLQGDVVSDPALLYNPRFGSTEAYVRSSNNEVQYRYWSNGWSDWVSLGGANAGGPSAIYNPQTGSTEIYTRTRADHVALQYWANTWSGWIDLTM